MTNKEKYKQLCEAEGSRIPLFLQYWWMEIVCTGKVWDVALTYDAKGEQVEGAWAYLIGKKMGFCYVLQPQLTQYSGPWIRLDGVEGEASRNDKLMQVMTNLVEQMEQVNPDYVELCMSPQWDNWMALYQKGYQQTTRYTYRFEDISQPNFLFENFDKVKRKKIRHCAKESHLTTDITASEFAKIHTRYWQSRGEKDITPQVLMVRLIEEAVKRGNGLLLGLVNEAGTILGAHFIVYDTNCAYLLLSILNPEVYVSGVSETLVWEDLKWFSDKSKAFDFEGSMEKGVEYFNRSFGAHPTPYFKITKCNSLTFSLLRKLKH